MKNNQYKFTVTAIGDTAQSAVAGVITLVAKGFLMGHCKFIRLEDGTEATVKWVFPKGLARKVSTSKR